MSSLASILMAALGIGFLIFIHELGHYLAARAAGVRVEVFSLGFGQRLFGFQRNGTDYRFSLVPFGGYVRVAGEDPTQRTHLADDDLYAKGFGARLLFFSGGVIMNLLVALVLFPVVFKHGVDFPAPVIGQVVRGDAAWEAGLQAGDRVVSIDGKRMYSFDNMRVEIALAAGRPLLFEIERDGVARTVTVRPRYDESMGLYAVGMRFAIADEAHEIASVDAGSPAAGAGVRAGDRIVAINDRSAIGDDIDVAVRELDEGGAPITLRLRDANELERNVTFVPEREPIPAPRIGVTSAARRVQGILDDHPAVRALGLARGDVVLSIDGAAFDGAGLEPITRGSGPLTLQVRRGAGTLELRSEPDADARTAIVERVALAPDTEEVRLVPLPDSAAALAGIRAGDLVVSIDGNSIQAWPDLVAAVESAGERAMDFALRRLGAESTDTITVTPARPLVTQLGFDYRVGYRKQLYQVDSIGDAIGAGFVASIDLIKQVYVTLKRLLTGEVAASNLSGIVGISRASYHYATGGWAVFLYFLAMLSINLAFVNILPIPVLDGGHVMFLLIEKVKGSPVSTKVLTYSQVLGLVFVLALMLYVTYNDILRLL